MLDRHFVRENPDKVADALRKRGMEFPVATVRELDTRRRSLLVEVEALKKQRNDSSKMIGQLVKKGQDPAQLKDEMRRVGDRVDELEKAVEGTEAALGDLLKTIPNIPHASVPEGASSEDNPVVRTWGEPRRFDFEPKAHWDLGPALGILDFERAAAMTGARFSLLLGAGARLERALINFMLDLHTKEHGYLEVLPPYMVNAKSLFGTGQLPKFEADLFKVEPGGYYLIPTAEVPVTNIHAGEILDGDLLPISYCAYTPCFRSEAGFSA